MMESPQLLAFRMLPDYSKPRGSDVSELSEADSMGGPGDNSRPLQPPFKPVPVISIDTEEDEQLEKEIIRASAGYSTFLHPSSAAGGNTNSRLSSPISFISVTSSRISSRLDFEASKTMCTKSLGLLLAFVSGVLMTAYSSMIKMLHEMDSMEVVVMRGLLQMLVMGSVAVYNKRSFIGPKDRYLPILLFLVSFTGGLRLLFIFTSFSRLPLGDSTTIVFSSPVFVMLFSICILKEPCGLFRIGAGASLLAGVVLIAKPPVIFGSSNETYDIIGYTLVCGACLMSALGIVLTKKISKKIEKTVILFYLGLASAVCGTIGLFAFGEPSVPPARDWGLAVGISCLGLLQQYCLIYAVTLESPARVTIVRQMQIVLAYIVQAVMFEVIPMYTDILGATLVLGTVITITFENKITAMACGDKDATKEKTRKKSDAEFVEKGIKDEKEMKG